MYAAHDPAKTRLFAGLILITYAAAIWAVVIVSGGAGILGNVVASVVAITAALTGRALTVERLKTGYTGLLAMSYAAIAGLMVIQALFGRDAYLLTEIYLGVALSTAAVHPPKRVAPLMVVLAGATLIGEAQAGFDSATVADWIVHLGLWTTVCLVSSRLMKELRTERVRALAGEQVAHTLAETDALTGLGNRRRLVGDLNETILAATPDNPTMLVLLDLDGFKFYNDSFGHSAGDALLTRVGHALAQAMAPDGQAYRLGGDEFCVVIGSPAVAARDVAHRAVAALSAEGEGFSVTASHGVALMPAEAATVDEALVLADQRMYADKGGRRQAEGEWRDLLLGILREREPQLYEHTRTVSDRAASVARKLGLDEADADAVVTAAALHDIGKIAIPDAILQKQGPLTSEERAFMRDHTVIGERIMARAPALRSAARLVRSSHERWDGTGYPDSLAGDAIPLGARI
ncbi:MAG: hypothetical protein QOF76_4250, partial [Solirubrobacteraceae bacterium]|nr:hypothetical protein [Solirubrobacteraceae bacterium]